MHVMIDMETMGTTVDSAILSIGAVKFDPNKEADFLTDRFYQRVNLESCVFMGLRMDPSTVMWWMQPERSIARQKLLEEGEGIDLMSAMFGFAQWLTASTEPQPEPIVVWSNGANFDIMIARSAFLRIGYISADGDKAPWKFWNERCFRTLKNLVRLPAKPVAHHALQDAVDQAHSVQAIVAKLGITL